mgnify:CR=1 FL=1
MAKIHKALVRAVPRGARHIRNSEIPMSRYNSVHTGPKRDPGGLKAGLANPAYHVLIASAVAIPEMLPTARGMARQTIKVMMVDVFMRMGRS